MNANACRLRSSVVVAAVLAMAAATGCAGEPEAVGSNVEDATAFTMTAADQARILDLVNYPGTDAALLDGAVGLDSRAVEFMVAHRNGADHVTPTADDDLFDDIGELDAIPFVADTAFRHLAAYAAAHPAPAAESVEGVLFRGWEAEAITWGVNQATQTELDVDLALDARAAKALLAKRPFTNVSSMGPVAYVGTTALSKLKAHAAIWWGKMRGAEQPCAVTLDDHLDRSADAFDAILDMVTTLDYPYANVVSLSVPACFDVSLADDRAALVKLLVADKRVGWAVDAVPTAGELTQGSADYVNLMLSARDAIQERVDNGWKPSDADQSALLNQLPATFQGLTGGEQSSPDRYYTVKLQIEDDECSEYAAAILNPREGTILVVHHFPGC